jgi:hypothetical protein
MERRRHARGGCARAHAVHCRRQNANRNLQHIFASFRLIPKRLRAGQRTIGIETRTMPSLIRFLTVILILAAAIYGGLYALAHFVQPKPREITVSIPPDRFFKNR